MRPKCCAHAASGSDKHLRLVQGETVLIGTATDPYQPAERRYRVTRGILEVLAEHPGMNVVMITKSPLVTRDVDLLRRIARHLRLSVHSRSSRSIVSSRAGSSRARRRPRPGCAHW